MGLLQQVAQKAFKFATSRASRQSPMFEDLHNLVSELKLTDLNYDPINTLWPTCATVDREGNPPCVYTAIYEDELMSMGVFGLRSHGELPLHDHPNMYGLLKVIYGRARISSFTKINLNALGLPHDVQFRLLFKQRISRRQAKTVIPVQVSPEIVADHQSPAVVLDPLKDNLHKIEPVDGETAFFDLLMPPYYPDGRNCHYYAPLDPLESSKLPLTLGQDKILWLCQVPIPDDYFCDEGVYAGERVNLDEYVGLA